MPDQGDVEEFQESAERVDLLLGHGPAHLFGVQGTKQVDQSVGGKNARGSTHKPLGGGRSLEFRNPAHLLDQTTQQLGRPLFAKIGGEPPELRDGEHGLAGDQLLGFPLWG